MTSSSPGRAPLGAYLAIVGAALTLISFGLPWFSLDTAAYATGFQHVMQELVGAGADAWVVDPGQGRAFAAIASERAATRIDASLLGYRDGLGWVLMRLAAACGALAVALRIHRGDVTGRSQRTALLGFGALLALRPAITLLNRPFTGLDGQAEHFGLTISGMVEPAAGLWVGVIAAGLVLASAALAHVGDAALAATRAERYRVPVAYAPGAPARPPMGRRAA